ncbi:putative ribosome biogenesis protein slx9-like [Argonauta hians]
MGKYACKRWRFHHSAVKCGDTNETKNEEPKESVEPLKKGKNIFAKLNMEEFRIATKTDIPENAGSYKLQNATKTPPQKTKKEKFREKKEYWKNQINSICSQRLKSKERERMKNTPIVGDMTDMLESLPTVSAQRETRKQKPEPYKAPVKLKSRQKEMMENIGLFKQVLNHPMFQRNPSSAIKEHLQNKVEYMNSCQ